VKSRTKKLRLLSKRLNYCALNIQLATRSPEQLLCRFAHSLGFTLPSCRRSKLSYSVEAKKWRIRLSSTCSNSVSLLSANLRSQLFLKRLTLITQLKYRFKNYRLWIEVKIHIFKQVLPRLNTYLTPNLTPTVSRCTRSVQVLMKISTDRLLVAAKYASK
jgi:hypothetical protein